MKNENKNGPLVSVLMTTYNREKFITESIESVLFSSYTNFELIIVDDASTDQTAIIAQRYAAKDNRVRLIVNESNIGDYPN
ncbi:MAG: glycosyltransferase family 2 protein, partial [Flavobacterium sp.]